MSRSFSNAASNSFHMHLYPGCRFWQMRHFVWSTGSFLSASPPLLFKFCANSSMPISSSEFSNSNNFILNASWARSIWSIASARLLHVSTSRRTVFLSVSGTFLNNSMMSKIFFSISFVAIFSWASAASFLIFCSRFGWSGISTSFSSSARSGMLGGVKSCNTNSGSRLHLARMWSSVSRMFGTVSFESCIFRTTKCSVPTSHLHRASNSGRLGASAVVAIRAPRSRSESGRLFWASSPMSRIVSRTTSVFSSRSLPSMFSNDLLT
mmetsp:Transcript_34129/g.98409  ORF Transcript_34129/g.98409 Transcript_34129/m.98409 type:complete len:266 (-) Transcript_34129:450-1247(-)